MTHSDLDAFEYFLTRKACINGIEFRISHDHVRCTSFVVLRKRTPVDVCGQTYDVVWKEVKDIHTCVDSIFSHFRNASLRIPDVSMPVKSSTLPEIKDVVFNPPATVILWDDGTKTVVKVSDEDDYDSEKGLAMAIAKKALGNRGNYYETFKKWLPDNKILEYDWRSRKIKRELDELEKAIERLSYKKENLLNEH